MKRFLKASEIGVNSADYKAKALGLKAVGKTIKGENIYSLKDAEEIINYKPILKPHPIRFYDILALIITNQNLLYNSQECSRIFKIKEARIKSMIDEYIETGCFVTQSKINYEERENASEQIN